MHTPHVFALIPYPALASALVASIWHGVLLAVCVSLCLRLLPELTPGVRSTVWTVVLLAVVASPWLPGVGGHAADTTGILRLEQAIAVPIIWAWAACSGLRAVQLLASAWRLGTVVNRSIRVEVAGDVAGLLATSPRRVILCSSVDVDRPSVAGFFRPRILLPPELLADLSEAELSQIVVHELEHLRRFDDWTNLLQQLSLVLLPLNPVLPWVNRRLALERELACDDRVLQATRARKAYAVCLARVAESSLVRRGVSLALGALGNWRRRSELAERVERILRSPKSGLTPAQLRVASCAVLASTVLTAGLLTRMPQLISFGGSGQIVAEAHAVAPVAAAIPAGMLPHPTLVRASLPAVERDRAVQRTSPGPQVPRLKKAVQRRAVRRSPMLVLTSWQDSQPRWVAAPVRFTRVVFQDSQDSQSVYTAVRWADGWLIVQL